MEGIDPSYEEQYEQWKIKEKQMEEDNPYGFWPIIGKDLGKMIANWEKVGEEYKKTLGPERLRFIKRCEMCANNIQMQGREGPQRRGRVRALCAHKEGRRVRCVTSG